MANKGLVTGFRGTPHIDADDIASFNTGVIGPDDYVLNTRDGLKASMSSANTFALASGDLIMQGRHVTFPTPTLATVESGTQGMKRNDLAVCRYTKASNGVENAELKIIKGTPTQNTPADPEFNNQRIIEGATIADMPLYRIPITGITVDNPIPLYKQLPSMWDSVSHMPHMVFGTYVSYWQTGSRQGVRLATPEKVEQLLHREWDFGRMMGFAMCTSDDQLDVTSCDYNGGFNCRFNVWTAGLHRINWVLCDFSQG